MGFGILLFGAGEGFALPPCPESGVWDNCTGTYTSNDGSTYVGEFKRDKFHGQGTYTWADGSKHIGEWKDGNRHGKGTYISKEGYSEEVNFVEDKKVPLESEKPKKKEIDLKKEREKLEEKLKKLEEEKNKAKKVADKKKKIKEQHEKFYYDAYEIEEARGRSCRGADRRGEGFPRVHGAQAVSEWSLRSSTGRRGSLLRAHQPHHFL